MRRPMIVAGVLSMGALATLAAPVAAAPADGNGKKNVETVVDDVVPGVGDQLAAQCTALGYDVGTVVVTLTGWSQGREFTSQAGSSPQLSMAVFHYVMTVTSSNGTSTTGMDVGPDRVFQRDGRTYVSVSGRSPTGSGVVGRVVFELDANGNIIGIAQDAGSTAWVEAACADLA